MVLQTPRSPRDSTTLPIGLGWSPRTFPDCGCRWMRDHILLPCCTGTLDRKSTRLNSSHGYISYAVFCLKKKKKSTQHTLASLRNDLIVRRPASHTHCV